MRHSGIITIVLCTVLARAGVTATAGSITAIKADRIETLAGDAIENGVILIRDTKIIKVGSDIEVPAEATVIDASDKTVFPGLINPVSTLGLSGSGRGGPASYAQYRVVDELYPFQHDYQRALQAGFTTLALVPGEIGIRGQSVVIKPVGRSKDEMIVAETGALWIGFEPNQRAKDLLQRTFQSAKNKRDSDGPDVAPLKKALSGDMPVFAFCDSAAATVHLLEVLDEFKDMKLVLVIGSESSYLAEQLAKKKIPVVVRASIDYELFTRNRMNVPRMLAEAGVTIACRPILRDVTAYEDFRRQMAELVKCGLDAQTAKRAMTLYPARALGLDYRLGTLEKGKDANLLILDGDILDVRTTISSVMIEGKTVYENPWGKTQ